MKLVHLLPSFRRSSIMTCGRVLPVSAILMLAALAIPEGPANAQCPAVGADTGCGAVITVTNTGATVSFTGQGPYDLIEDTLVGVINNSNQPIHAMQLRSALPIFAFDFDGICGTRPDPIDGQDTGQPFNPRPVGCPFGSTGYEGPSVSFSDISTDKTSGIVHFGPPIATGGGTAYFALEENISAVCSCPDVVNNSVTHSVIYVANNAITSCDTDSVMNGTPAMTAIFTPRCRGSTSQAAKYCGFTKFNWIQKITNLPDPSPFYAVNPSNLSAPIHLTSTSTPFNDPYQNGLTCSPTIPPDQCPIPSAWNSYPFYWDPNTTSQPWSLNKWDNGTTLCFADIPKDACLSGGTGAECGGNTAPAGSSLGFMTHLAGILPDGSPLDLGIGFTWTDSYNGSSGGISTTASLEPGSGGTGGITVTSVQNVTSYQYNGIVVTTVNGTPIPSADTTPPVITILATPDTLWPPNGKTVTITVSGEMTDDELGGTGVNPSTAAYAVTDKYGQVQPKGSVALRPDGSYSFTIQLQAARNGNDKDGRQYIITVSAQDNAGNKGSAATGVIVPHDQGH